MSVSLVSMGCQRVAFHDVPLALPEGKRHSEDALRKWLKKLDKT